MTLFAKWLFSTVLAVFIGNTLFNYPNADAFKPIVPAVVYEYGETPTIPTETTIAPTTTVSFVQTCGDVVNLARQVGFPEETLGDVSRIALRESNCTNSSFNPKDPNGGSYGLMQINGYWCIPNTYWPIGYLQAQGIIESCDDLFSATANLRSALAIYLEGNSTFASWGN